MFDKSLMPNQNDMGRVPRRFTCVRCDKPSIDHHAGYKQVLEDGTKLETENIDLCNKCFKKTQSEARQTDFLREKLESGELSEDDLKRLAKDKNFKRELYEGGGLINKKGDAKARTKAFIAQRLKEQKEKKKDV